MQANQKVKEQVLTAVKIKADGTTEELGVLAYYSSNPFKMLLWKIKQFF